MADRPRHPKKQLEDLIRIAEGQGWTFTKGRKYFTGRCPCGLCSETVHLSPSNPNYARNKLNKMKKCPKWQ